MVREVDIEWRTERWATKRGWLSRRIAYEARTGAPDRIFVRHGVVVFIEFKRPGGRLSGSQVLEIKKLRAHGAEVHVCWSFEQAKEVLSAHD